MNEAKLLVDIILGHNCNFRCKYCYNKLGEDAYNSSIMDEVTMDNVVEYLTQLKIKYAKGRQLQLCFFGGEPLLHIKELKTFIEKSSNIVDCYAISTNGYKVHELKKEILEIANICHSRNCDIWFSVSFDYALQNENRNENSHDIIWNNILWLNANKLCRVTGSVLTQNSFSRFHEMFFEAVELTKLCNINSVFNIDRTNYTNISFDEEKTRESLKQVRDFINEHPEYKNVLRYNNSCKGRNSFKDDCIVANIISGIDYNGDIYPMQNLIYERTDIKNMFKLGNVSESFDELEQKRNKLFSLLNRDIPEKCKTCSVSCRVFPWKTIKTDISEFSGEMDEEWCKLHFLIDEYLGSDFSCVKN